MIYDDTTARPNIAGLDAQGNPTNQIGYLVWGSNAGTLYGSGRAELDVLSVNSSGAQVTTSTRPGNVFRIQYAGGVGIEYLVETSLARWGANGLAFLATDQQAAVGEVYDQIVLISGPFVTQ